MSSSCIQNNNEPICYSIESGCLSNAPAQRKRLATNKVATFTLMVVGESGLGKSTFIRSLFGSGFNSTTQFAKPMSAIKMVDSTSAEEVRSDVHKSAEIEVHHAIVIEDQFETELTVVNTPGFGDYTDNTNTWVPVANYIDAQHRHYMCQEEQPDRSQLTDTRVHVCFYFLAPTSRISELDLAAMRELSKRVNLIPLIAKADSMTRGDLLSFKTLVREVTKEAGVEVWMPENDDPKLNEYQFKWPFGIVSSDETIVLPNGQRSFGRKYRWGSVDVSNPEHSDFALLKDIVFGLHMLDLIDSTNSKFYNCQKYQLRLARLGHALSVESKPLSFTPTIKQNKIPPEERTSVTYTRNATYSKSSSSLSVAEEAAASMSGIEILSTISKLGLSFLNEKHYENDVLLKQRLQALKAQFDVVAKFQEEKFDHQATDLQRTRDEFRADVEEATRLNMELMAEVKELERPKKR